MASAYAYLRGKLVEYGLDQRSLAEEMQAALGHGALWLISERMTGKSMWRINEIWFLMERLNIPPEDMAKAFPPDQDKIQRVKQALRRGHGTTNPKRQAPVVELRARAGR